MTIRVFLVDDHRSVLWGLQRLIDGEKPRMEVVGFATSIEEALAAVPGSRANVVLLDLDLGGKSGIDAIPRLIEDCATTRILVLTGMRDPEIHDKAVVAGACGVVTKEDSAETILKAIEKASQGELWLDRASAGRVFVALSRRSGGDRVDPVQRRIATLTARERQIVTEMASDAGASTRQVAARLCISEHTLRNHLTSIYDKLMVGSRVELWAFANKHGLARKSA
jgi:two-component system, NarL family, nitrate/nitrite response regulator NarL